MLIRNAKLSKGYKSLLEETEAMLKELRKEWDDVEFIQAGVIPIPIKQFKKLAQQPYKIDSDNQEDGWERYNRPVSDIVIGFKDKSWLERQDHDEFLDTYWVCCQVPEPLVNAEVLDLKTLYIRPYDNYTELCLILQDNQDRKEGKLQ